MSEFNPESNPSGPKTNIQPVCILSNEMLEGIIAQWCYDQGVGCEVGINWLYDADGSHTGLAIWDVAKVTR